MQSMTTDAHSMFHRATHRTDDGGVRLLGYATLIETRTSDGGIRLLSVDYTQTPVNIGRTELGLVMTDANVNSVFDELEFSSSEEMHDRGFPFNVPDQLTEAEGREMQRILDQGAPRWVRAMRQELQSERP